MSDTRHRCRYATRYRARRLPRCGCEACKTKFAKRIARRLWRGDYEDGIHTVRAVLDLAKVW